MYIRKIITAVILVLICLAMLVSASFAWIALARAPEINGVETNVGSNGSLEIALLSDTTYMNPTLIRASVGDSAVIQEATVSNLSWGNIVDLSHKDYGMSQISLLPSRLNIVPGDNGRYVVSSNILSIPEYGLDGRFSTFNANTVSAIYREEKFTYNTASQSYGVRAIGTASNMTPQQAALAGARTSIRSYAAAASSAGKDLWSTYGSALVNICYRGYGQGSHGFTEADLMTLQAAAAKTGEALSYMDAALRQGIVGYAAAAVEDGETFQTLRSTVENPRLPLSAIVGSLSVDLPGNFTQWIQAVENGQLAMARLSSGCKALSGGSYSWNQIHPLLLELMDPQQIYMNNTPLSDSKAYSYMTEDNQLTLAPGAGILASIADFAGDYTTFFTYTDGSSVEMTTLSAVDTPYMLQIADILVDMEPAGSASTQTQAELEDIYGFAADFAFRCNTRSDLLLQTFGSDRVEGGADNTVTQGSGSFMQFNSHQLTRDQMLSMMDAVRLAFVDNQNTVLAVAKLNVSNYTQSEDGLTAPLYLYDYAVTPGGSIQMGERLDQDSPIITLPKGSAAVISVIVWLDGDYVDNSIASITAQSMSSTLNLQFGSSADLVAPDLGLKPGR